MGTTRSGLGGRWNRAASGTSGRSSRVDDAGNNRSGDASTRGDDTGGACDTSGNTETASVDAATGVVKWATQGRDGNHASILFTRNHLVFLTDGGVLIVAERSGERFTEARRYEIGTTRSSVVTLYTPQRTGPPSIIGPQPDGPFFRHPPRSLCDHRSDWRWWTASLRTKCQANFGESRRSSMRTFSPDGKWIAYSSDESGRREVYVQGFVPDRVPAAGVGKWQMSTAGGDKPRWRRDGKEL